MFSKASLAKPLLALLARSVPGYECPRELRTRSNGTVFVDEFVFSNEQCRKVKCPVKVPRAQDLRCSGAATPVQ